MSPFARHGTCIRLALLACALMWRILQTIRCARRPERVTLCYHSIRPGDAPQFRRHMGMIAPRARADQIYWSRRGLPKVAVTFDDGFTNFRDHALPVLRAVRIPATLFVVAGDLGQPPSWLAGTGHPDCDERLLSARELMAVAADPLCTIGAHTATHPMLTRIAAEEAKDELTASKAMLERVLGERVDEFAFPHGAFNETLIQEALACGYRRVHTLEGVSDDPQVVGRMSMSPDAWDIELKLVAAGAYAWLPAVRRFASRCGWRPVEVADELPERTPMNTLTIAGSVAADRESMRKAA